MKSIKQRAFPSFNEEGREKKKKKRESSYRQRSILSNVVNTTSVINLGTIIQCIMSVFIGIAITLLLVCILMEIQEKYVFYFEWIQDVDLNKVLIVWYNKYTDDCVTREHKILYDTGGNKK